MEENKLPPRSGELKRREQQMKRRMVRMIVFSLLLFCVLYAYGTYKSRVKEEEAAASRKQVPTYHTRGKKLKKNVVTSQGYKTWQRHKKLQKYKAWQHYQAVQQYEKWQRYQKLQRYKAWLRAKTNDNQPSV